MSASPNTVLRETRLAQLYQVVRERAAKGERCPTNNEIATMFGKRRCGHTGRFLLALQDRGLIEVDVNYSVRVVTIVETGETTARPEIEPPRNGTISVRAPGAWHSSGYDSQEKSAQRLSARDAEAARIAALIQPERSPCPVCGVRSDFGCKHRKRA